jgi:hypothetical protein
MAVSKTGSITFEIGGQEATSFVHYAASLAAVKAFATVLQQYTYATIKSVSYTEEELDPGLTPPSGAAAIDFQLILKFRKPSGVGTQQIAIPAPAADTYTLMEGLGYRAEKEVGETAADGYTTLMSETYVFESGWLT